MNLNLRSVPLVVTLVLLGLIGSWFLFSLDNRTAESDDQTDATNSADNSSIPSTPSLDRLRATFDDANLTNSTIDIKKVLHGGVAKDGIPALTNPKLDDLSSSDAPGDTLGILVEHNNEQRFYPYNILVSHEIVNDSIGDLDFVATFCPLCGSAIVFNRNVGGEVKEFGVSGFLFESNLIMYDRTAMPSLWSQARGEAIIGDQAGTVLDLVDFQLLTQDDVKSLHPDAKILSTDTGFSRSYNFDPYSGYEDNEETFFPISVNDIRFPAKEVFFVVPSSNEQSVAIQVGNLNRGEILKNNDLELTIEKTVEGQLIVKNRQGEEQIGYYEMWFSWAQHHQDNGDVWSI